VTEKELVDEVVKVQRKELTENPEATMESLAEVAIPIIKQAVMGQEKNLLLGVTCMETRIDDARKAVVQEILKEMAIPIRYDHNKTCYDCLERLRGKYLGKTGKGEG